MIIALLPFPVATNSTAASILARSSPGSKLPSSIYFLASSIVISDSGISSGLPLCTIRLSLLVRNIISSAPSISPSLAAVKSFSMMALAPFKAVPCCITGIPPPPQAITTWSASERVLIASISYMSMGLGEGITLLNPFSSSTTKLPLFISASASSRFIYLPITLVGLVNALSNGSTLTCVIMVHTVLYIPLLSSSSLILFCKS